MIVARALPPIAVLLSPPAYARKRPSRRVHQTLPPNGNDRVYAGEQFSNTISVINPSTNKNLGVIRLGDPQPMNLSPVRR
jgi:YVTN family beta-propeller protein